jgi:hypothetical protein
VVLNFAFVKTGKNDFFYLYKINSNGSMCIYFSPPRELLSSFKKFLLATMSRTAFKFLKFFLILILLSIIVPTKVTNDPVIKLPVKVIKLRHVIKISLAYGLLAYFPLSKILLCLDANFKFF